MARKNIGTTTSNQKKNRRTNKKDIVKMLISLIGIIIFVYILYKIISLIIVPTDIVMIENGIIFNEENAVRLCYKKWKNSKRE